MSREDRIASAIESLFEGETITAAAAAHEIPRKTLSDRWRRHLESLVDEQEDEGVDRLLLIPDTHAPYHSRRAWDLMLKVAEDFQPDTIIHLGDLADFYSVSSHSKDPDRASNLEAEMAVVRELRQDLDDLAPERKIFIEGNHEFRLGRYIHDKAPELNGLVSVDGLLKLSENGWEHIPYRSHIRLGKLYLTHDTNQGGKYSTARALETFQHSVAIGHHHQIQYFVGGDATGQHQVGAQFGWLGDIESVDYMSKIKVSRSWSLGFGIGYHDLSTGFVYLVPVPLVDFTACVEGKIYRG